MQLIFLLYIILFLFVTVIEGELSSLVIVLFMFIIGWGIVYSCHPKHRFYAAKLFSIVSFIYVVSAVIISFNYVGDKHFVVYDVVTYTPFLKMYQPDIDFKDYILSCFIKLSDNNALHEVMVRGACIVANNYLGGATIAYIGLLHTVFGVISIMFIYKTLLLKFDSYLAFKFAVVFALCSPCLFYSCVVIRDICITSIYTIALYLTLSPYKWRNVVLIFLLAVICVGFRLYSGIFLLSFAGILIIKKVQTTKLKVITIPCIILLLLVILVSGVLSNILEQTQAEILYYQDLDAGRTTTDGLSGKLLALPNGIKQVALFFYSQIQPFPFYVNLLKVSNITQFIEAFTTMIFPVWWFTVFYFFFYVYTIKRKFKMLSLEINLLILLSFIFILVNTAQIDVRRIMPVYPFLYVMFLDFKYLHLSVYERKKIAKLVSMCFVLLWGAYFILKFR